MTVCEALIKASPDVSITAEVLDEMPMGHLLRLALEKIECVPSEELVNQFEALDRHQRTTFVRMVEDAETNPALRWMINQVQRPVNAKAA